MAGEEAEAPSLPADEPEYQQGSEVRPASDHQWSKEGFGADHKRSRKEGVRGG